MNRNKFHQLTTWLGVAVLMTAILACNLTSATPGVTPTSAATNAPVNTATVPPAATVAVIQPTASLENTATATSTPIVHAMTPGEPPTTYISAVSDSNSSTTASTHRANGGENFNINLFERPFSSTSMDYFPDLDIIGARLMQDTTWV